MPNRLRALVGLTYPARECQAMVAAAGGLRCLTADERARLQMRRVEAGEYCDDLPDTSIPILLEQGAIALETTDDEPATPRPRTARKAARPAVTAESED